MRFHAKFVGARLLVLPAVDSGKGNADEFRELGLRHASGLAEVFNFFGYNRLLERFGMSFRLFV